MKNKGFRILVIFCFLAFLTIAQVHGQANISVPQAREIALAMTGGGAVTNLELVSGTSGLEYRVIVSNNAARYYISMNAQTGEVISLSMSESFPPPLADMAQTQGHINIPQTGARLDEAAAVALARAGGGVVRHICLDRERGIFVYHVRIYRDGNRLDFYLDRNNLAVVRERARQHNNASVHSASFQRRQMSTIPYLTFNQAASIALAHKGGGSIREVSRSYIRGRPAFDVDITVNGQRWCFYIDLFTGEIMRYHRER